MATATVQKQSISLRLNNGTSETGAQKYKTTSFPSLSVEGYDDAKALSIANTISAYLDSSLLETRKTTVASLTA